MNKSLIDAGIPLLTEVLVPPPAPAERTGSPLPETAAHMPAPWDQESRERLELEMRERVLHQVLKNIDGALEQRVRDSLADVLQLAVSGLAEQIRAGLHETAREVVTRAVAEEIAKLQATKK